MRPTVLALGLLSGCFVPPNETIVGRVVGGGASGGSAGGVAGGVTAGGSTAGGVTAGGAAGGASGGTVAGGSAGGVGQLTILLDAGVIPSVGTPPAICNTNGVLAREVFSRIPADAGCGNGCVWDVIQSGAELVFRSSLGSGDVLWQDIATGPDFEVMTMASPTTGRRLAAVPFRGGPPQTIEPLPNSSNITVWGASFLTTFAYTLSITNQTTGQTSHALKIWRPNEVPALVELASLPSYPRGPPAEVSFAGRYALQLDDGLYIAPMYAPGQAQRFYASNGGIGAFVVTGTGTAYFSEQQGTETVLYSASLFGSPPTVRAIGRGLKVKAIAPAAADEIGVLTDDGVYVVTPSTGQARLIYAGGPFIQGFLRLEGLISLAGHYYVGDLCYPDADAPDWGTVELTAPSPLGALPVRPGSARWITGSPGWPWSTPVVDHSSASWSPRLPILLSPRGGFIITHISP